MTSERARIEVGGAHEHERMNPAGIAYLIGCFREAPGCVAVGQSSAHFSWFPGCTWRVAVCGSCLGHLGWAFQGGGITFHGLILARLVPDDRDRRAG